MYFLGVILIMCLLSTLEFVEKLNAKEPFSPICMDGLNKANTMDLRKPSWFKRKVIWNFKKRIAHTFPFKVLTLFVLLCGYLNDVGWDTESAVSWFTMRNCYRYGL